ncbi:TetR/AcrR family transcriptional regulator [Microbacterium sp. EST19A]|uniref:TetR/AcrR family transcriptional regulator n=1 Tax=Microbacterium sp. EST19A TaxID=2862681 RepID=UPI001CBC28F7|nr:TetR/AcrR family transcriptional regulator [Microbacterium sp. EST19A]
MDLISEPNKASRRRGDELEAALLSAAWDQLMEAGYGGFTFDAIAERAHTSKPVLYRRWPTRSALLAATLGRRGAADALRAPETGSVRTDLIAVLEQANERPERFLVMFSVIAGGFAEEGLRPEDIRDQFLAQTPSTVGRILDEARHRGEIPDAPIAASVRDVLFDLFRMRLFLASSPLPRRDLISLVDDIYLPLITA